MLTSQRIKGTYFDSKARKCIFLGYGDETKAYRLDDLRGRRSYAVEIFNFKKNRKKLKKNIQLKEKPYTS